MMKWRPTPKEMLCMLCVKRSQAIPANSGASSLLVLRSLQTKVPTVLVWTLHHYHHKRKCWTFTKHNVTMWHEFLVSVHFFMSSLFIAPQWTQKNCQVLHYTLWGPLTPDKKKLPPKKSSPSFFRVANPGTKEIETSWWFIPRTWIDWEVKKRTNMAEMLILIASWFGF